MAQVNFARGPFHASFNALYSDFFTGFATGFDAGNLADGAGESDTMTIPGVALGDQVIAFAIDVDQAGMTLTAYVSAANTVTMRVQNESGGAVNLAACNWSVLVGRPDKNYFRAALS